MQPTLIDANIDMPSSSKTKPITCCVNIVCILLSLFCMLNSAGALYNLAGLSVMDANMIPKFASKDEEIDFWKALSLKYKKR